jgi:hypothetical protein
LNSVQSGCSGTGNGGVWQGIDLNLRNGEVGQIHESVLNFRARGCFCSSGTWGGPVADGTSGKAPAKHVGESQGEVLVVGFRSLGCGTPTDDKLHISGRVLTTVTGRIVAERANAGIAVVAGVATITFATLGTLLVPKLVIRVGEGIVLIGVDVGVVKTATMTTAAIRAGGATATTALETIKTLAFSGGVVTGSTAWALGVLVKVGGLGYNRLKVAAKSPSTIGYRFVVSLSNAEWPTKPPGVLRTISSA